MKISFCLLLAVTMAKSEELLRINLVTHDNEITEKLGMCEGDCDKDSHCQNGLYCVQRDAYQPVPGCLGGESDESKTDYCARKPPASPTLPPPQELQVELVTHSSDPIPKLGPCQGDCDNDSHCQDGLRCFQRRANVPVPGCRGGDVDSSRTDYCTYMDIEPNTKPTVPPTPKPISAPTLKPTAPPTPKPISPPTSKPTAPPTSKPPTSTLRVTLVTTSNTITQKLGLCQGDCDSDAHCQDGMKCFQRDPNMAVPGCIGGNEDYSFTDYCTYMDIEPNTKPTVPPTPKPISPPTPKPISPPTSKPPTSTPRVTLVTTSNTITQKLGLCQGDCDSDAHCQDGMKCFQRDPIMAVPGCSGGDVDYSPTDYCIHTDTEPTSKPVPSPTIPSQPTDLPPLVSYGRTPPSDKRPLGVCEGDCDTNIDCQEGLTCFQRTSNVPVPGCSGNDESSTDYCVDSSLIPSNDDYVPGLLNHQKLGLLLSQGLDARLLATSGEKVVYANGQKSKDRFHLRPDAGATFPDPRSENEGGWIYVSNAEVPSGGGGVGAITFNKKGEVLDYKYLLKGTSMNCGGGRTPWNTWVSCEEVGSSGQIYQVDPTGEREPQVMTLGRDGGAWESFAYDIRNKKKPSFFATEDASSGALRRFVPDNPNWDDKWNILHGPGVVKYLKVFPEGNGNKGTYVWTTDRSAAKRNAEIHYPNSEGIDVKGSELFFVCKNIRKLFVLNLDNGTYRRRSTVYGMFDGAPDQVERVLEGESELLYFTEEGGKDAGVHSRDAKGLFRTILESPIYHDETTGLSFYGKFMYVAYQENGHVFAVWKKDGTSFIEKTIDVKSHHQASS